MFGKPARPDQPILDREKSQENWATSFSSGTKSILIRKNPTLTGWKVLLVQVVKYLRDWCMISSRPILTAIAFSSEQFYLRKMKNKPKPLGSMNDLFVSITSLNLYLLEVYDFPLYLSKRTQWNEVSKMHRTKFLMERQI